MSTTEMKITSDQHPEIIKMHLDGMPRKVIAQKYGISVNTVARILNKNGYYCQVEYRISPEQIRAYGEQGLTMSAIAEKTGIPYETIRSLVKKKNIPIKKRRLFTQEELEYICDNAGIIPVKIMGKKLGIDKNAISRKLSELNISGKVEIDNFNLKQIAKLTGLNYSNLRYAARTGKLKSKKNSHKLGSHVVPRRHLMTFLAERGLLTEDLRLFLG
jgi:hypothetical protein